MRCGTKLHNIAFLKAEAKIEECRSQCSAAAVPTLELFWGAIGLLQSGYFAPRWIHLHWLKIGHQVAPLSSVENLRCHIATRVTSTWCLTDMATRRFDPKVPGSGRNTILSANRIFTVILSKQGIFGN